MTAHKLHRWNVTITYRCDSGDRDEVRAIEEMSELHDIVERGPSLYAIKQILIEPAGRCGPVTVEDAEAA